MLQITELSPASHPAFDGHETVIRAVDPDTGLHALIAVHDTSLGPSLGGCRIRPFASETEALTDVLRLSRGMTYKSALAGLPLGGGKAVILADPGTQKTEALMESFGRAVESLGGRYITAEDVGSNEHDMITISRTTSYVAGLPTVEGEVGGNPSPVTAYGVYCGIMASVRKLWNRNDLAGMRVAVQGLGAVGFSLCEHLAGQKAKLIVADVDEGRLRHAQEVFRGRLEILPPDRIHAAQADIFAPCALGAGLNDSTIPELTTCRLIAGAANNQLAEPRHDDMLRGRGILYAPDYVINAGGVIAVGYEYFRKAGQDPFGHAMGPDDLNAHVEHIGARLLDIYAFAHQHDMGTGAAADRLAREALTAARAAAE